MTLRYLLVVALAIVTLPLAAGAWNRSPAVEFADLPHPLRNPEGLTVDRSSGEFYVADFDYRVTSKTGRIAVFDRSGRLLRVLSLNSSPMLLGLDFHPITHELLVIDSGGKKVLRVNPWTGASSTFAVPALAPDSVLNALTFDKAGNVYISDSFQGIIWKTGPAGGVATAWLTSPLLLPNGVPPFGANGLAFNSVGVLFVANTANDTVVQIPVVDGGSDDLERSADLAPLAARARPRRAFLDEVMICRLPEHQSLARIPAQRHSMAVEGGAQ